MTIAGLLVPVFGPFIDLALDEVVSDTYFGPNDGAPRVSSWTVVPQIAPGSRYGFILQGELF